MTTRNKSDYSSPWRYSTNGSDAYFGQGESQTALIGLMNRSETTDDPARLIISTTPSRPMHISFKNYNTLLGRLYMKGRNNIVLGNTEMNIANLTGSNNIAIGGNNLERVTSGYNNIALGVDNLTNLTTGYNR